MTVCLAVLFAALRIGIRMRKRRLAGAPRDVGLVRLHVKLAVPAVAFAMLGFLGGALSSRLFRDWELLGTFHAALAVIVVGLFAATAHLGFRVQRGRAEPGTHGLLGVLAMLGSCLAAIAGFVLLP